MKIDWSRLSFSYLKTNGYVKYTWREGSWSKAELVESEYFPLHIASTALNYAQVCFEGLKAFRGRDGKVRIFRPRENAKRMINSSKRILLEAINEEIFLEGLEKLIEFNSEFIPPYESGGSLYIRPVLFGSGEGIGITVPEEFSFILFCSPVGLYYKTGNLESVESIILECYDRSAPYGLGAYKVAGNYASNMLPLKSAKEAGYPINLFLDPKENCYIDEFGTSNFFAIKENSYITPKSDTVLPSITNDSLATLAQEVLLMEYEKRPIHIDELSSFSQVAACGTAVVVAPIKKIVYRDKEVFSSSFIDERIKQLYKLIQEIQYGECEDQFNWCVSL